MSKNRNGDQSVISCASLKTSVSRLYPRGLLSDTTREGGVPASMVFDGGVALTFGLSAEYFNYAASR